MIILIIGLLVVLSATLLLGSIIITIKAGEQEGISDYGYKDDK